MSASPHRLNVPARSAELAGVRRCVARWAAEARLPAEAADALALAVDEALTNAIEHGCAGRPEARVEVEAAFPKGALTVTVRHRGLPFDPTTHPLPTLDEALARRHVHGYGLHLMRRLVDELAFAMRDGAAEVRLTKRRT